jgi:hypothetical protein
MKRPFTLTAQLSTGHSLPKNLTTEKVLPALQKALDTVPLDVLIVGWVEIPDLYHALVDKSQRQVNQVFLWYPMLSDFPGMQEDHLIMDYQGHPSHGWGDFVASGEMSETFRFACPNNPDAVRTSLSHLERLLTNYDFDGVFLDKIRFPSPANGLPEVFSCFCNHCRKAAERRGLDLCEVQRLLIDIQHQSLPNSSSNYSPFPGASWMDILLKNYPLLQEFIRFRCDSITNVVEKVNALTTRIGKKIALDVYSPALAPLVGQDLPVISKYAEWVKPMIYRFAKGPASLRLEIPMLINEISAYLHKTPEQISSWVEQNTNFTPFNLDWINQNGISLDWVLNESDSTQKLISPTPVYLGTESVRMPGIIEISPENIEEIIDLSNKIGLNGLALSWDLLHTPLENLLPLREVK